MPLVGAVVAGDPHEPLAVDVDAVLALRPFVACAFAAPRFHVGSGVVEHHDRRAPASARLRASPTCAVDGSSQTRSWASTAKLDTSPSFHCAGTFGQPRSTSKVGRLRAAVLCREASAGFTYPFWRTFFQIRPHAEIRHVIRDRGGSRAARLPVSR